MSGQVRSIKFVTKVQHLNGMKAAARVLVAPPPPRHWSSFCPAYTLIYL